MHMYIFRGSGPLITWTFRADLPLEISVCIIA